MILPDRTSREHESYSISRSFVIRCDGRNGQAIYKLSSFDQKTYSFRRSIGSSNAFLLCCVKKEVGACHEWIPRNDIGKR